MKSRDDTITFSLSAEETVVNDTVKIIANISAIVVPDMSEENLRTILQSMMHKFIPDTKWIFAGINRRGHSSGSEEISLVASTRVPETQNRGLEQRRRDASMPEQSISISSVSTDITFPSSLIEETEERLRLEIVRKALEQCAKFNKAMNRTYRIKSINYGSDDSQFGLQASLSNSYSRSVKSAASASYGTTMLMEDASGGTTGMGNAQKLTLAAVVTLGYQITA